MQALECEGITEKPSCSDTHDRFTTEDFQSARPAQVVKDFRAGLSEGTLKSEVTAFQRASALGSQLQKRRIVRQPAGVPLKGCPKVAESKLDGMISHAS